MIPANQVSNAGSQPSNKAGDVSMKLTAAKDDNPHTLLDQSALRASHREQNPAYQWNSGAEISSAIVSSDLWSAAYHEAVDSLGKDIDVAILMGSNVTQLFRELENVGKEATQESAFLRGVAYLHSIQVPLERFKLALDLASPLSNLDPTAATVFGVVKSVTAVSLFHMIYCTFECEYSEMLTYRNTDCHKLRNR